jgi:hypothetical protein
MRPLASLGILALATALGAVILGELAIVPGVASQTHLVDANLATALAGPVHMRIGEIALAATFVLAAVVPRWLGSRRATAAALLAFGSMVLYRIVLLPAVYAAWSRVDRVAGRPVQRMLDAERLADQAQWVALAVVVCLGGLVWMVAGASRPSSSAAAQPITPKAEPPGAVPAAC